MASLLKSEVASKPPGVRIPLLPPIYMNYRFQTIAEANEWRKKKYPNGGGLYQEDRVWLGEIKEAHELYLESFETGKSMEDLYDIKHGILRFDI